MTLSEYIRLRTTEINRFQNHWETASALTPDVYPEHLEPPEWDEQFDFFVQNETSKNITVIK